LNTNPNVGDARGLTAGRLEAGGSMTGRPR